MDISFTLKCLVIFFVSGHVNDSHLFNLIYMNIRDTMYTMIII